MKMTGSTKIVADKDTMGIRKIERERGVAMSLSVS